MPKRTFERCFGILKSGGSLSRKKVPDCVNFQVQTADDWPAQLLRSQTAHRFQEKTPSDEQEFSLPKPSSIKNKDAFAENTTFDTRAPQNDNFVCQILEILRIQGCFSDRRVIVSTVPKHCQSLELSTWKGTMYRGNAVKPTPKFGLKIMVWGALSFRGFYLEISDGPGLKVLHHGRVFNVCKLSIAVGY